MFLFDLINPNLNKFQIENKYDQSKVKAQVKRQ